MKIYLLRHGESTSDRDDIFGGEYDDELTESGRLQAAELGRKLRDKKINKIFVSPKLRTTQSAEIINKTLNTEIEIMNLLRVRNHYGVMTGLTQKEALERYPHLVELFEADTHNTIEGGESYDDFYNRVVNSIEEVMKKESDFSEVAILTHRGFIRALFRDYLKLGEIVINFGGYVELECQDNKLSVVHLENAVLNSYSSKSH